MSKRTKIIIIIAIVALVVGILIYFYNKKKKEKTTAARESAAPPTRAETKAETIKTGLATGTIKVAPAKGTSGVQTAAMSTN